MNNEMNDFSIPGQTNAFGYIASPANYIVPGKRPLSSISPTIVEHLDNGTVFAALGSAGGSRIITVRASAPPSPPRTQTDKQNTQATIQNLWHLLDQNMTSAQALAQPRIHDQLVPNVVSAEWAYDNATLAYLAARGSNITYIAPGSTTAQALRRLPNGTFEAAGEPRQLNSGGFVI